jgi:hypothetical protein
MNRPRGYEVNSSTHLGQNPCQDQNLPCDDPVPPPGPQANTGTSRTATSTKISKIVVNLFNAKTPSLILILSKSHATMWYLTLTVQFYLFFVFSD